jgi:hypothetical protein
MVIAWGRVARCKSPPTGTVLRFSNPVGRSTACLPPKKGEAAMKYPIQSICKRCHREMAEVANILPMGGSPGLLAFLCAQCGKSNSILVESKQQIRGKQLDAYQCIANL